MMAAHGTVHPPLGIVFTVGARWKGQVEHCLLFRVKDDEYRWCGAAGPRRRACDDGHTQGGGTVTAVPGPTRTMRIFVLKMDPG
jgi:hypothetical protein